MNAHSGTFGKPGEVAPSGFTWGGDFGSSIDFTTNGMSSIDANMYFGYKNPFFRTIGIGAGINSSLGNANTFYPIFALIRTSFVTKPSLCFAEVKGGYSFNSINSHSQQGMFGSVGIGINLYSNNKLHSYIIVAYNYFKIDPYTDDGVLTELKNLQCVSVRIGVSF